jgi:hypothetical protein
MLSVAASFGQVSFFPEISGWKVTQDDPVYDANNLWDIIDGAADLYLEYEFVDLHIARYIRSDSIEVKVEIYRHGTEADAFGIYSQERDPRYNFIQIGVQGYLQKGVLNFLDGLYYIKMSTYQTGSNAQQAMLMIAKKLSENLKQNISWPKNVLLFPTAGKLPNTEQYVARNFLGYSFLNKAYVAAYKDSVLFKLFIIEAESPEKADIMIAEYLNAVPKRSVKNLGIVKYQVTDANAGMIEFQKFDNYVVGVMNCPDRKTCEKYINEAAANLVK